MIDGMGTVMSLVLGCAIGFAVGAIVTMRFYCCDHNRKTRGKLLESAVIHARDAVIILRAEQKPGLGRSVLYVNEAFTRMTGYPSQEVIDRSLHLLRGPDTSEETLQQIRDAFDAELPLQVELLNYRKDRSEFWVELSLVPVSDDVKTITHWIMIQRDISDRKFTEEQLRHAQKMETVGQLAGGIAHDFNNLLTSILGNLAGVQCAPDDPNRERIAIAERAVERAGNLTGQLLGFARKNQLLLRPIRLTEVIEEVVELYQRSVDPRIRIELDVRDHVAVQADPSLINQVLLNLCMNARDAMPEGGILTISLDQVQINHCDSAMSSDSRSGEYVRLAVADTGFGIAPEIKSKLFEPFFTTKPQGQGTGLGLSMSHGIIRQHHGWIDVHSQLGHGTRFEIYLPVAMISSPRQSASITRMETQRPVPDGMLESDHKVLPDQNGTILFVDDEDPIRELALSVLQSAGYTVVVAANGLLALEIVERRETSFDLVVLDMTMPQLSGREVYDRLQMICPDLPVLFSSGYFEADITDLSNVVGLLPKPYRPRQLLEAVKQGLTPMQALIVAG